MTGQEIQDKLDAIVEDLQGKFKGSSVQIAVRGEDDAMSLLPLSSDVNGVVNQAELDEVQAWVDDWKVYADSYSAAYDPVKTASENFKLARQVHQQLIDDASAARTALSNALEADGDYQAAKNALDNARSDPAYVNARESYQNFNVSENFGNLGDAKGKYI